LRFILPDAKCPLDDKRLLALALREFVIYKSPDVIEPGSIHTHRSPSFIWRNFSSVEAKFRWTNSHEASLAFNWNGTKFAQIRVRCDSLGPQKIKIFLNGMSVYEGEVDGLANLIFNAEKLKRGINILAFMLPGAKQPNDVDKRLLALAVSEIEFHKQDSLDRA
jgi:hypothetical protein